MEKEKSNNEKAFHESDFNFKKFEKIAEMMKSCCSGERGMTDCCYIMRKMMKDGDGKETEEKNKDRGKTE